jgi:thiol-disulfide isomerase/thioredoxin
MKNLIFGGLASLLIFACGNSGSNSFRIEGTLRGDLTDGTPVILKKSDDSFQTIDVDSTTTTSGTFRFEGEAGRPELYFVYVEGLRGGIPLILENGNIEINAHKDSLQVVEIGGTPQNDAYSAYLKGARELSEIRASMNEDLRQAMMQQDSALIQSLRDEFFELQDKMIQFESDFATQNTNALISLLILDRMLETGSLETDKVNDLFNGLSESLKSSTIGKGIQNKLTGAKLTALGSKAPEFSGPTPDGTTLSLKDAMGKVTLIDFWAGWCKPCRAENPNVVAVYQKYKDKGLKILGVSLDRNPEEWRQAIADDGLEWNHISNIAYFNDEIAQLYNIRAIPASFVLDENGIIIAKDLRGADLEAKMAELLGD